jgi:hypothetical protein
MVCWVATFVPSTHTSAWPTMPLMINAAAPPGGTFGVNSVRNHQGTANLGVVTGPTRLS